MKLNLFLTLKQSYLQSLFESYSFFWNIFTADEGPEVDVGEEAAVWTNILLISPVLPGSGSQGTPTSDLNTLASQR